MVGLTVKYTIYNNYHINDGEGRWLTAKDGGKAVGFQRDFSNKYIGNVRTGEAEGKQRHKGGRQIAPRWRTWKVQGYQRGFGESSDGSLGEQLYNISLNMNMWCVFRHLVTKGFN